MVDVSGKNSKSVARMWISEPSLALHEEDLTIKGRSRTQGEGLQLRNGRKPFAFRKSLF